jgi:hypothetical protein
VLSRTNLILDVASDLCIVMFDPICECELVTCHPRAMTWLKCCLVIIINKLSEANLTVTFHLWYRILSVHLWPVHVKKIQSFSTFVEILKGSFSYDFGNIRKPNSDLTCVVMTQEFNVKNSKTRENRNLCLMTIIK